MTAPVASIELALGHHQAGRLQQAAEIYRQLLAADPRHAAAWHLLGLTELQADRAASAIDHIRRAIELEGQHAAYHANLGEAYRTLARWAEAQAAFQQAVQRNPQLSAAHFGLGSVCQQLGQSAEAIAHFRQVLTIDPGSVPAQRRLGLALHAAGESEEAIAVLSRASACDPNDLEVRFALAGALQSQQRWHEADEQYRAALAIHPRFAEALNGLGVIAHARHRPAEAIAYYAQALALKPDYFEALYNWGITLAAQGHSREAAAKFRDALVRRPGSAAAHTRLGTALQRLGQLTDAAGAYRQAIGLQGDNVAALCNLGTVLHEQGHCDEAVSCFERALAADPNSADTYNNLGNALEQTGHSERALACYQKSLQLAPEMADAHHNLGLYLLAREQFAEGWREYAWRLKCKHVPVRPFSQPLWQGEPLAGRTLLLHAEQGFGDTLQMLRYVAPARQRGGRVLLEVQPQLAPLVRAAGFDDVISGGGELLPFDVQAPLLSLPGIFGADGANMASGVPYLSAEPRRVALWQQKLGEIPGFKIGIAWQGNAQNQRDRVRSIPLAQFAPLAAARGVRLVSLQKGPGSEQLSAVGFPIVDFGHELDAHGGAFMDTAALVTCLDLVVTSDTALAHLTGALGARGWLALAKYADWRWFENREDSPWYPSLRLFRQQAAGDWRGVFERMADMLAQWPSRA